ncbi:MAG: hypothetical protein ACR2HF_10785 [Methylococcaceae bacterium]
MIKASASLTSRSSATEVDTFLAQLKSMPVVSPKQTPGRLLFGLDATASREASWDIARHIQADMFKTAAALGGLTMQVCHYRGLAEFHGTRWVVDSDILLKEMAQVECLGGQTQILRVLEHALAEARLNGVDALVFVGDCVEEDIDRLCRTAGELGLIGVRAFMFLEGRNPEAERAFRQIARLTRGACCRFDAGSARQLRELLTAVATYAAGGMEALRKISHDPGGLLSQLTNPPPA